MSIDDILLDPKLGSEFESLASRIATKLKPADLRLGALYIRKTRFLAKKQSTLFEQLNSDAIEGELLDLGPLSDISHGSVPPGEGLLELLEDERYLYVAANTDLPAVIEEFVEGPTLDVLGNHFWHPNPHEIRIRVLPAGRFQDTPVRQWQLKLISERAPVFNWPIPSRVA